MNTNTDDNKILKIICRKKAITIDGLSLLLNSSLKTARRRLKQWEAYTSYNKNGRYYTIPSIPEFNENGIWSYQGIYFSKYGNLTQTTINLSISSKAGLDAAEMQDILGIPIRSFLTVLQKQTEIKREKVQGRFVYFSAVEEVYLKQKEYRATMARVKQLPSAMDVILILVETIKNPHLSIEELSSKLRENNCNVNPKSIRNLFAYHGLSVKKTPQVPS